MVLTEAQKRAKAKYTLKKGDGSADAHRKRYAIDSSYREFKKSEALKRYYRLKG
jgi:hypothetical protein